MRPAASGVLGSTFAGRVARYGRAGRDAGPKPPGDGNRIADLILGVRVLPVNVLSMFSCLSAAGRARS
jgi:hypothetical protein